MDRNFFFEEIDPDIEPDIEFDKINNDNIDNNDDKTHRDKNRTGKSIYKVPAKESKKHMYANHNMIGQLAVYSHGSTPNIVIESKKERISQKISYWCESTRDFYYRIALPKIPRV